MKHLMKSFLGMKRKYREYVKPTGIWIPSFWDTPEDIAMKEAQKQEQFMINFRDELMEAEEEREKERLDELTQKLR